MAHLAEFVQRRLIWLLLATFAVAAVAPRLGLAAGRFDIGALAAPGVSARLPMLLVAIMLFCAAMSVDLAAAKGVVKRPALLLLSLAGVWVGPVAWAALVRGLPMALVSDAEATDLLLGIALVAAMPVANSSAGWTQQAGGAIAWSLALVIASILLTPLVTPIALRLLGHAHSANQAAGIDELFAQFSGMFFLVWVLAPTALGAAARVAIGKDRVARGRSVILLVTAAALLFLNYINASFALPPFLEHPRPGLLAVTLLSAAGLSAAGVACALLTSRLLRVDHPTRLALCFSLGMKHNGLALAVAHQVLVDRPVVNLLIIAAIVLQHTLAGAIDAWSARRSLQQ